MMTNIEHITLQDFRAAVGRTIWPGTIVLMRNGESGWLNRSIAWAQRAALRDLGGVADDMVDAAAEFTHAAVVYDAARLAELYRPQARYRSLDCLPKYRIALVLPVDSQFIGLPLPPQPTMQCVAEFAANAIRRGDRYPTKELLYYLKWVSKRWRSKLPFVKNRSFFEIFRSEKYDVCSGAVWQWCRSAGLFRDSVGTQDEYPEAWYPARFLVDRRFYVVGIFDLQP